MDVIIADPALFTTKKPNQRYGNESILTDDFEPREEKKISLNTGYRETLGCLAKMEDISNDVATCETVKMADVSRLDASRSTSWEMIYRTVLQDDDKRFVIQALGQKKSAPSEDEFNIRNPPKQMEMKRVKINLFEMQSGV